MQARRAAHAAADQPGQLDQGVIASQSLPMFAVDKDAAEAAGVRRPGCTNTPSVF